MKKKDGPLRLCIDYRDLTPRIVKDAFLLPQMDEIFTQLDGEKYFATLDLASSYWLIEMHPQDRAKTAFILPSGLYEFNILPMGLAIAAATYLRVMQIVLQDLIPSWCLV